MRGFLCPVGTAGGGDVVVIGRAARRAARTPRADQLFGRDASVALDVLELLELAWHDCYAEVTPPDEVVEDLWVVSRGDLRLLVGAARLALEDARDLRMNADAERAAGPRDAGPRDAGPQDAR